MSELDDWQTEALERARAKLQAQPDDAQPRRVVEEFLHWRKSGEEPQSFAWFMV